MAKKKLEDPDLTAKEIIEMANEMAQENLNMNTKISMNF